MSILLFLFLFLFLFLSLFLTLSLSLSSGSGVRATPRERHPPNHSIWPVVVRALPPSSSPWSSSSLFSSLCPFMLASLCLLLEERDESLGRALLPPAVA